MPARGSSIARPLALAAGALLPIGCGGASGAPEPDAASMDAGRDGSAMDSGRDAASSMDAAPDARPDAMEAGARPDANDGGGPDAADSGDAGPPYWTVHPPIEGVDFHGVHGVDANHVWAVGTGGSVYFYDGESWSPQRSGSETLTAVFAADAERVYVAGDDGIRGCSFDGGETWDLSTSETGADFRAVAVSVERDEVQVAGTDGVLEQTTLACESWEQVDLAGLSDDFYAAWVIDEDRTMYVGSDRLVARNWSYSFGSYRFSRVGLGSTDWFAVWGHYTGGSDPIHAMVVGDSALGYYTTDASTWRSITLHGERPSRLNAIWGPPERVGIVVVGEESSIFISTDLGALAEEPPPESLEPTSLRGVWGSSTDDVWVVGAGGTILHHP